MSSVRMCDKCFTVFSETEDGWQTFTATTTKYDAETGEAKQVQQRLDACPSCALQPRSQFQAERRAALEGNEQQARIAKLEREVGIAGAEPVVEQPPAAG